MERLVFTSSMFGRPCDATVKDANQAQIHFDQWYAQNGLDRKLSKLDRFAMAALQGIMANPQLQAEFWKRYEDNCKIKSPPDAADEVERSIAYRAYRVARAMIEIGG